MYSARVYDERRAGPPTHHPTELMDSVSTKAIGRNPAVSELTRVTNHGAVMEVGGAQTAWDGERHRGERADEDPIGALSTTGMHERIANCKAEGSMH